MAARPLPPHMLLGGRGVGWAVGTRLPPTGAARGHGHCRQRAACQVLQLSRKRLSSDGAIEWPPVKSWSCQWPGCQMVELSSNQLISVEAVK